MSRKALPSARPVHPCLLSVFDGNYGAEYSTWAHITTKHSELPNLVTAQASTLRIYTIGEDGKLELTESFCQLAGSIVYLDTLVSPSGPDSLLIGFAGHPRLAICSLQEPNLAVAKLLVATSLIDLTPALMDASLGSVTPLEQDLVATVVGDGPDKTLAMVLGGGVAVAAVALHFSAGTWHASEPFILPLSILVQALPLHRLDTTAGAATASNVSAYQQTIAHGFGDIWSACFLSGYLEPTLVLLHSPAGQTWSGRLATASGSCQVTAISVTVPHHQAAVLWSMTVPADALYLKATGKKGCLVVCTNSILQITNGGRMTSGCAMAVNGWASATSAGIALSPNPWPLPKMAIQLDGACIDMISETLGIVVLRHGDVYLLQLLHEQWSLLPVGHTLGSLGQVSSLLVLPMQGETSVLDKILPKAAGVSMGLVFCGSRMGDSSLLGYTLESNVTLVDAMQGKDNSTGDSTIKQEDQEQQLPQEAIVDDYEIILQGEEDALYALDDEHDQTTKPDKELPDVIPPSDEENDETTGDSKQRISNKRAKLTRMSVMRSLNALDSLTAVGPLGPGCEGPLCGASKRASSTDVLGSSAAAVGGSAKIMPCGHGSSGGLALVTAPGRDDRSILVEEDCLNVQSIFCLGGLVLMGMIPKGDTAGINALRIESHDESLELSQVDMGAWYKSNDGGIESDESPDDISFVFSKTQLLAAVELINNAFCVIVRLLNADEGYALVTYKDAGGILETVSNHVLSTGFPSTLLQVSPFLRVNESTLFGTVWSLGCAIVYTIDAEGELEENMIEGTSSLVAADDDDEEVFYQSDRVTSIDIFKAPGNLFDQQLTGTESAMKLNCGRVLDDLDDEDRELYQAPDTKEGSAGDLPGKAVDNPSNDAVAPEAVFVAVSRQNGQLQVFKVDNLETPVWDAMGCGHGVAKLSTSNEKLPRHPRMHKVYSREIRFFVAGPAEGAQDYFFSVSTNVGDVHLYKVTAGELVRVSLRLPARPSKKQSEHHTKLRRKKILPSDAVDESVVNAKEFYHNQLSRFDGISGHSGLFAATARPMWFLTERRSLVALSHRSRHVAPGGGKARPVSGFCAGVKSSSTGSSGFMTLHERIGRVGSQRLTIFKGISNFFTPLGLMPGGGYCVEKIPMGVTVHRVQFIDDANVSTNEHPLYAVLISREVEVDQSNLNDDGLEAEERKRIKDEKQETKIKRQVEADLGGFDMEQEWVEEIERDDCFDVDSRLGGAPPIRNSAYSLWIVDAANNWNVVDSHELGEFELGLTMKVMYLTEISIAQGSHSAIGDEVGKDSLFVAVGTGIVDRDGEDVSSKGRVRLFQVARDEAAAALGQVAVLSVVFEKDILSGPVTSLSCLTTDGRSRLVIGAAADVNVEQWGMNKLTQVGFFRATMQILDIKLFKNFFILSDAYDSLFFLVWRESDKSLTLLAKDYEPIPVYAAGLISRGAAMTFVCHDDRQNLQFFQYAPGDAAARGGNKLVSRADIHLGAQTVSLENHFCRSSILINSATPASTLAALKSQDSLYGRGDDDQRLGINFGTSDGGFSTLLPLNEPDYWRLAALQSVMANAMESDCALNPRAWRLFRRTPRRGGCRNNDRRKGVIDGDLVIQYCDLPTADQEDLASAIGSTVELIMDNLVELRCSSMVI